MAELSVSYFDYPGILERPKTFIPYWDYLFSLLKSVFSGFPDDLKLFEEEYQKIKQKTWIAITAADQDGVVLLEIIYQLLIKKYQKTPMEIIKEFYSQIRDKCFQGGFGHSFYMKKTGAVAPSAIHVRKIFFTELGHDGPRGYDGGWPHHWVIHPDAFHMVKTIKVEVYLALVVSGADMEISQKADYERWGN